MFDKQTREREMGSAIKVVGCHMQNPFFLVFYSSFNLTIFPPLFCFGIVFDAIWHFASISCGKSVTLVITDIPSHHTLVASCGWPKYLSWSSIYVHLSKVYPIRLALVMKTSESCVVVCHLRSLSCHLIDRTQLIFDYANYIVSSCTRLRFRRKPTRKKKKSNYYQLHLDL